MVPWFEAELNLKFQFLDRNSFGSDKRGFKIGDKVGLFQFLDRNSFGSDANPCTTACTPCKFQFLDRNSFGSDSGVWVVIPIL